MSEISDMLRDENNEKKRTARGAFNKKTHNGKGGKVKFPSDYLSKREKQKMNGEVKNYIMNKPVSYEEFKKYPNDLKIEYITKLRERFDVPDVKIAGMMGCPKSTFALLVKNLGIGLTKGGKHTKFKGDVKTAWDCWRLQLEHERGIGSEFEPTDDTCVSDFERSEQFPRCTVFKKKNMTEDDVIEEPRTTLSEALSTCNESIWISRSELDDLREENKILKAKLEMVYLIFGQVDDNKGGELY